MTTRFLGGEQTLSRLRKALPRSGRIDAAVAYAMADDHLGLRAGDNVIVCGTDRNVARGSVDPSLVGRWRDAGVAVASHDELHAKVVVCGNWVAVGSANLSARAEAVNEAVMVSNEAPVVRAARRLLVDLAADATELDDAWVATMKPLFGTSRPAGHGPGGGAGTRRGVGPGRIRRPGAILPVKPGDVWVAYGVHDTSRLPQAVAGPISQVGPFARFAMCAANVEDAPVEPGDLLIWIDDATDLADAPLLIVDRPARAGRRLEWALAAYDRRLDDRVVIPLSATVKRQVDKDLTVRIPTATARNQVLERWGLSWD